jgi:hypothetical protein
MDTGSKGRGRGRRALAAEDAYVLPDGVHCVICSDLYIQERFHDQ